MPPGLSEGTAITVVSVHGEDVTVQTEQGREFVLAHWLVDVGRELWVDGLDFLPENDPRALAHLESVIRELRQRDPTQYITPRVMELIWIAERVLARNKR